MTTLTLDRAQATSDATALTATESAVVGIGAALEARTSGVPSSDGSEAVPPSAVVGTAERATAAATSAADPADDDNTVGSRPAARPAPRTRAQTPVRPHLVPALGPIQRLTAPTGPGHSRPPTLDERVLARRRAALAAERAAAAAESAVGPVPTSDPTSVCCSLVLAAVEALAGIRAMAQLARWVTPEVYEALSTRAALTVRVLGAGVQSRRPEVRRVRVCRIGEHAAEASVVIDDGRRVRAVAVRLESWRGTWRAVALEIG